MVMSESEGAEGGVNISASDDVAGEAPGHYVAIGASAGGLEAIQGFFANMPASTGLAFIVVQHLSPDYKSLMVELLSKRTSMTVLRAEDGMLVCANRVYLIPPKKNLTIFHGRLLLSDQEPRGLNLPIDVFLRSLADDCAERAVAIVLSGTGSDGVRGIRAIKECGGVVMVQDESAKFDGMPRAAISTGLADFVLSPEQMPSQLLAFVKHPYASNAERASAEITNEDCMTHLFAMLRDQCKVDFTHYKRSTVARRIERRMTVHQIDDVNAYVSFLRSSRAEVSALFRELLIGVTSFFRDVDAFERLARDHLPALLSNTDEDEVRFWVAGCSTGEEAYTLAMLAREAMDARGINRVVRIFATDIDRDALHLAAAGVYPESIAADIAPPLLARYFSRRHDSFQVSRKIREMVVFAPHNLIKDPPFTNISLVSCRNVLIYMQPVLQRRVLEHFNFSLTPRGLMLLGTSETVGETEDSWEPLDPKWKIFRSRGRHLRVGASVEHDADHHAHARALRFIGGRRAQRITDDERVLERFLDALANDVLPLSLVVNPQLEVLHVIGDAEGFFRLPSGRLVNDVSQLATKDLAVPLTTGIQRVFRDNLELRLSNLHTRVGAESRTIDLRIKLMPTRKGQEPLVAVMISDANRPTESAGVEGVQSFDLSREASIHVKEVELELQFTRENLQATIEELETTNEELQATNEELLASNEELQSTNEELQSTNEELFTVNSEAQSKITELVELQNDVDNLLSSSQIGQLILDENLDVRRFSQQLATIVSLRDGDIGRPIGHITHELVDVDLLATIRQVQRSQAPTEREVRDRAGRWHLMRVVPYRIGPRVFSGTVVTFVDITRLKEAELALEHSRAEAVARASQAPPAPAPSRDDTGETPR